MKTRLLLITMALFSHSSWLRAQHEIGFIEKFALAKDREAVLKELIPGTEDHFFYNALHLQNTGKRAEFATLMEQWAKRNPDSGPRQELERRQWLLDYDQKPEATLAWLQRTLGINFHHQQEVLNAKPDLPTALDPKLISEESFHNLATLNHETLDRFTPLGLEALVAKGHKFTPAQARNFLSRIQRPDLPALVEMILADLATKESRGFGEFAIHNALLVTQLEALAKAKPELKQQANFVNTWLGKLRPNADVDLSLNAQAREAWLDTSWAFVKDLAPTFNSLKAHLLYQRLVHDQKSGQRSQERFLAYLQLPRPMFYVHPKFRENELLFRHPCDPNADFSKITTFPPIGNEEPLVREYLLFFLKDAPDASAFAPYIEDGYLKAILAEAKLTGGVGDAEAWFSLLPPSTVQQLRERVDLDFDLAIPQYFAPADPVKLTLHLKNVPQLLVNIYEINTLNYYRSNQGPIGTDLNLDGLVPNQKQQHDFSKNAPILRVATPLEIKEIPAQRGVWVVDFIGNGKSSRALIRKGRLHYVTRPSSAGTAITVLDEAKQPLPKATAQMGGQSFSANEKGEIIIPFSNQPGQQPVILTDGNGFAQLERIFIQGESYALAAGFHVPRETLLSGKKATLIIRPTLTVNGSPVDLSLLEDVKLTLLSTNQDGISSSAVVPNFKLTNDQEAHHEFNVPDRLASLQFTLTGRVKSLISGHKLDLAAQGAFNINEMSKTEHTSDLFLSKIGPNYIVQDLGRNGEPRQDRAVTLRFWRPEFHDAISATLKTDATGSVNLGPLDGISRIAAHNGLLQRAWTLATDRFDYPTNIQISSTDKIILPAAFGPHLAQPRFSLLEVRNGTFVRIPSDPVKINEATDRQALEIGPLEPGDYSLLYLPDHPPIQIRVTAGPAVNGWLLGESRHLQRNRESNLDVAEVAKTDAALTIKIFGATPDTRVHVLASRFMPSFDAFAALGSAPGLEPLIGHPGTSQSLFISGRTLGEEYRYVLERKNARKFPGVMLPRPGLLLNPWAIRNTATLTDEAKAGEDFRRAVDGKDAAMDRAKQKPTAQRGQRDEAEGFNTTIPDVDFLAETGLTALNLTPDANGIITLKAADLGDRQFVRVLAINRDAAVCRDVSFADAGTKLRPLTLRNGLAPDAHFTRQNQITILEQDKPFEIKDGATAEIETLDHLGKVFDLFRALSNDAVLQEFSFLLDWPTLPEEKKREIYSKYASHELSFFIHRKDPAFFQAVVLPYLANKREKTFMDHYLLGADLSGYLHAWKYSQLNVVERILLAQRIKEEGPHTARELKDMYFATPPTVEQLLYFFGGALATGALSDNGLQQSAQRFLFKNEEKASANAPMDAPMLAAPATPLAAAKPRSRASSTVQDAAESLNAAPGAPPAPPEAKGFGVAEGVIAGKSDRDALKLMEARKEVLQAESQELLAGRERDAEVRSKRQSALYRKLEQTQEWAENHYYRLLIEQQDHSLVQVNGFWRDFAAWDGNGGFISPNIAEAHRNFTEMALAMAVLDLPFPSQAKEVKVEIKDGSILLTPTSRVVLFHREIKPAEIDKAAPGLLVSQNFYRHGDRHAEKDGVKTDKFITEEFLTGVVYGCQIVVTNPTSTLLKLDLLTQIPQGAIAVAGTKPTNNLPLTLEPYHTHTADFFFYFPKAGKYPQHPVHVSKSEKVVAFAQPFSFNVVDELSKLDTASWDYVSQYGKDEDVFAFIDANNARLLNLDKIAWRVKNIDFFRKIIQVLKQRRIFSPTLWSYSVHHNDLAALQEYLQFEDGFISQCGPWLDCKLVKIDPVQRKTYQHLEYSPLVNARAHRLGSERTILNDRFFSQYQALLQVFIHKPSLDAEDQLAAVYYLMLQDRIEEALERFATIDQAQVAEKIQLDYLKANLAFYQEDTAAARKIAEGYAQYPVNKWREKFAEVLAHLDEIQGKAPDKPLEDDRNQQQNALAAQESSFDFQVENKEVKLAFRNLTEITVNYYPMDLEFLFSTAPFVSSDTGRFGMVQPNKTEKLALPADKAMHTFALPKEYHSSNVLVEILGGGKSQGRAYYANELNVQISENFGRLQVTHTKDGRPLSKVYVKVFAEVNGQPKFYKDGYTDLRGKFDYASLSTNEIDAVTRFGILILSDEFGAAVREAMPPRQ